MNYLISITFAVLISAVFSSAEVSVAVKICEKPVITQCQCGIGGVLVDVYVEGCQVISNESYPCQPCPGACHVFQNCKTCSKYNCLSCPDGKTGKTCQTDESFQTASPNKTVIQNVSIVLIENGENLTFHDNTTDNNQGEKVKDISLKTNESVEQPKNLTREQPDSKDIKLDSLDLIPKHFSDFKNDTGSDLNETSQNTKDLSQDNIANISDIEGMCTSNCSNKMIVDLLSQSPGSEVEEIFHLNEGVNASVENKESIKNEHQFDYANRDEVIVSDYKDNSFTDTFREEYNGTNIDEELREDVKETYKSEEFLKHRSPNLSLDKDTVVEKKETENSEQIEKIKNNINPKSLNMESYFSNSDNNMDAEAPYISNNNYDRPDYQDYPENQDDTKEHISSSERYIENDNAEKTLEGATNQKVLDKTYDFSKQHSLRRNFYNKEGEEFMIQHHSLPNSQIELFQSPSFFGNPFLFPKINSDSLNKQNPNGKLSSEENFHPDGEQIDTLHKTSQQTQSETSGPLKRKYYILKTNHNPFSLKNTDVNSKVSLQKSSFPSLIDRLLKLVGHQITSNQESSAANDYINGEVPGDIHPENVKNSDASSNSLKFLNSFHQAPGEEGIAPNPNGDYIPLSQYSFKNYFSPGQNKFPAVKGHIVVLHFGNTNETAPEVVRSRNFELDIPFLANSSDKKIEHKHKSERKKHGKGSKRSRKLKRHRLNEGRKKKCNPWREDCTNHYSIGKGSDSNEYLARRMEEVSSSNIGRQGSNRPDRIHIRFMHMDNSPRTAFELRNNSSESSDSSSGRPLSRRKRATSFFCPIPKETRHGDLDCTIWSYKKSCKLLCHDGYTSSQVQFTCTRRKNTWVPALSSCTGQSYNEPMNNVQPQEEEMGVDNGVESDDVNDDDGDENEDVVKMEDDDKDEDVDEESEEGRAQGKKTLAKKLPKGHFVVKKKKAHVNSVHESEESHEGNEDVGEMTKKGQTQPKKSAKPKHKVGGVSPKKAANEAEDEEAVNPNASDNDDDEEDEEISDQNTGQPQPKKSAKHENKEGGGGASKKAVNEDEDEDAVNPNASDNDDDEEEEISDQSTGQAQPKKSAKPKPKGGVAPKKAVNESEDEDAVNPKASDSDDGEEGEDNSDQSPGNGDQEDKVEGGANVEEDSLDAAELDESERKK